jgi:hypothetical protein
MYLLSTTTERALLIANRVIHAGAGIIIVPFGTLGLQRFMTFKQIFLMTS